MTNVTTSSGSRVPLRAIATVSALTLSFLVLAAGPARADCDVLDPTCVVEVVDDTTDEVTDTVDEVVDTVEETVDEVVETVEDVVETVDETVDEVVETVEDTVDPVTDPVDDTIDPIAPVPDPGVVGPGPGVIDPPAGEDPPAESDPSVVGAEADRPSDPAVAPGPGGALGPLGPAASVGGTVSASPEDLMGPFSGPAAELVKRLAFPLALILLVVAFVAVQNRLDRRDPKLALAATAPDVLSFA